MAEQMTAKHQAALALAEEGDLSKFRSVDMVPVNELRALVRTIDLAKEGIDEAVVKCRDADVPWSVIGASLGISRQAAQQRFGKVVAS